MEGKAIIFCAPSGAGKTTIVKHLISKIPGLEFSVSATTRKARKGEVHKKDYHFLTKEDFFRRIELGEVLEWQEVYNGYFYGTLSEELERIWSNRHHVIFDVDVKGAISLKKALGSNSLTIFVKVENIDILRERLSKRNSESEDALNVRLEKALIEMKEESKFDVVLVNHNLEKALENAENTVKNFINS